MRATTESKKRRDGTGLGSGTGWRAWMLAVAPALLASPGCNKTQATDITPVPSAAASAGELDGGDEVAPPPAVVAGDPEIPLNEAVVGTTPVPPDYAATVAPPAPPVEDKPASPDPTDVWVPGYWWWSVPFNRYVWVGGAWRAPPPDQTWTPGEWVSSPNGRFVWVPGFWGARGALALPAVAIAPPPPRVEVYGAPPGEGFDWMPGYYAFREGTYVWVGGSWGRPPRVGLGWVEPRYIGIGGRYHFQPGRWDYPIARRGVVYRPDPNVRAGARFTAVAVPGDVVAEHARYVTQSSRAIAWGGTRTANGGYVLHGANIPRNVLEPHGGGGAGEPHAEHPAGFEPHAGGPEPHAGGPEPRPGGGEPQAGGNEPHAGATGPQPGAGTPDNGHHGPSGGNPAWGGQPQGGSHGGPGGAPPGGGGSPGGHGGHEGSGGGGGHEGSGGGGGHKPGGK